MHVLALGAFVAAVVATTVGGSIAASSNVIITLDVASTTTLDPSGCPANARSFGTVLPDSSQVAAGACSIVFGSSNNSSMLRMYQADRAGDALFARSDGSPATALGAGGMANVSFPEGPANPKWGTMQSDGLYLAAGNVDNAGDDYVALARIGSNGVPDPGFGDAGGRKIHNFFAGRPETAWDGLVQTDGDILLVGNVAWADARVNNGLVMRFNSNGQPDLTFNGTGVLEIDNAGYDLFKSIVLLPTGSALAIGCSCDPFGDDHPLFARVRSDGTLDTSFGTNGKLEPTTWGTDAIIEDALLLASGKLLVSGQRDTGTGMHGFVARIDQAGALDLGYGVGGFVDVASVASTGGLDLAAPDGSAWLVGRTGTGPFNAMIARITAGGAVDTSWAGTGIATIDVGAATNDSSYGVLATGEGSAYVAGDASGDMHVLEVRNSATAPLDPRFSSDGKSTTDFGGYDFATELFWGREGTIVAVGTAVVGNADFGFYSLAGGGTIPDYGGGAVFGSGNTQAAFGACLEARSGAGVAGGWTVDPGGSCTAVAGDPWTAIADAPADATAKVLGSPTVGVTNATATIRFGVKTALAQSPREYSAPIVLEVVAPDAGAPPNNPPNVPTLVSPANGAVDPTDNMFNPVATFSDPDAGDTGRVEFQLCSTPACGVVTSNGSSPNGILNGANGSAWMCGVGFATEHWRARNVDAGGLSSAWSATRSYTFQGVAC